MRLTSFLGDVADLTSEPKVVSPYKVYPKPVKQDPTQYPIEPRKLPDEIKLNLPDPTYIYELETQARLGNRKKLIEYLELLHHQGKLDLDNLWVCPYTFRQFDHEEAEYRMFPLCMPYKLGMSRDDIKDFYHHAGVWKEESHAMIGTFVVDISSLELADKVGKHLVSYHTLLPGKISFEDAEIIGDIVTFDILQSEAILVMNRWGDIHIPTADEIGQMRNYSRRSWEYWSRLHRIKHPGKRIRGAGAPKTRWPERPVKQLLIAQFPERVQGRPYAIVVHKPTMRAFAVDGGYTVLDIDVDPATILHAMRYHRQASTGTTGHPKPAWTDGIRDEEFISYWVAE
jgi:hypothetical protein